MVTCILPDLVFLHTPKTGGTWITEVLTHADIPCELHPHLNVQDFRARFPDQRHKPILAFVRNPYAWLRSYWQFKMTWGWNPQDYFDRVSEANRFEIFIDRVLEKEPGICTRYFNDFVGPPEDPVAYIGHYETLLADFMRIIRQYYALDEAQILAQPPLVVSNKAYQARYTEPMRQAVYQAEQVSFERFGYAPELPEGLKNSRV